MTTEILLSKGQVQRGDVIYRFAESNPLFHSLGHETFVAAYFLLTGLFAIMALALPNIINPQQKYFELLYVPLALYGVAHLILGIHNLSLIIQFF